MIRMIGSFALSAVLTMVAAYIFFVPPNLPPGYVYVIIFIVFFGVSSFVINALSRMKKRRDPTNANDS